MTITPEKLTYGYNASDYTTFRSFAWKLLVSFGLLYMFFYNGRQNINLVMTQMAEGLGSTAASMGVISSALFRCYAFGQLINGRLGAFFGYKRHIMFAAAASAVLNAVISFQHSVPVIAVLWGLNGVHGLVQRRGSAEQMVAQREAGLRCRAGRRSLSSLAACICSCWC